MRYVLFLATFLLVFCGRDETAAAYGGADQTWILQEIDGQPFPASATLTFPETGQIAGEAPCNFYSGPMAAPYPWFEVGNLAVTRRACPDLAQETAFFEALSAMTEVEISGDVMILRSADGREMLFKADD